MTNCQIPRCGKKLIDDNRPPAPLRISTVLSKRSREAFAVDRHWKFTGNCMLVVLPKY